MYCTGYAFGPDTRTLHSYPKPVSLVGGSPLGRLHASRITEPAQPFFILIYLSFCSKINWYYFDKDCAKMGFIKKRKNATAVLFFSIIILFLIVSAPLIAYADFLSTPSFENIVPCGRNSGPAEEMAPCNSCHLFIALPQRLIEFAVYLSTFLAILGLAISGGMFAVSSTNTKLRERGKNILKISIKGFLLVLCAYLIVNSIFWVLGRDKSPLENDWGKYSCSINS